MRARTRSLVSLAALAAIAALLACGPKDFPDESLINSVRILASKSDQPYAHPGATVRSTVLAVDARPDASVNEPMQINWLPFVCVNPPDDAYYACFTAFYQNASAVLQSGAGDGGMSSTIIGAISGWDGGAEASVGAGLPIGGDAGAGGVGALGSIPAGTDISPFLIHGPRTVFHLPANIVSSHKVVKGATPYGLAVVFNIACAGHVEVIPLDPNNPDPEQIPFGCFNAQHQQLSADDYVIGYAEVFAFDALTNTNPVISSFAFRDAGVGLEGGVGAPVSFSHCNASKCPDNYAVTGVPDASWELDPQNPGDGGPHHEQIWVDYYATMGSLSNEAVLAFDPVLGRVALKATDEEDLQSVTSAQKGTLWAVAHDNRGGASWITVPLTAQ